MIRNLLPALLAAALGAPPALAETPPKRSFVGKKLPDIAFTDTEGHTIRAAHFQGSVLVMVTGIPW